MGATQVNSEAQGGRGARPLEPLRERPQRSAIVCDIDGTLAPVVQRPEEAAVPPRGRAVLDALARRFGLVACVSGRRASDARRIVGLDGLTYVGNHGLELLEPGADAPTIDPRAGALADRVGAFATAALTPAVADLGVTPEDKDAIRALHYRTATDPTAARAALERVAADARQAGLVPHWGRMVLEIRPPIEFGKGVALAALLERAGSDRALFGGDDRTDLDAFRTLEDLLTRGRLVHAVRVGVRSAEGPAEIVGEADLVVEGPEGFVALLEQLTA